MNDERYLSRVRVVVNTYDLEEDDDVVMESDFESAVNFAIEEIEALGAEIMVINFSTHVSGTILVKTADIEFALTQTQLTATQKPDFPTLSDGSKIINADVFEFIHAKFDEGMSAREIVNAFADHEQRISKFTVMKVLKTSSFDEYYTVN